MLKYLHLDRWSSQARLVSASGQTGMPPGGPVEKCLRSNPSRKISRRSKMFWNTYHLAKDVRDALQALVAAPGEARLIAGGSDLLLDLQQGRHPPVDTLVDISVIPELNLLEIRQEELYIGAAVPLNRIVASGLVYQHARALFEAAGLIGGPQVRNTATLGGNVAHALPAGDGTIALLTLNAQAEVASLQGCRRKPIGELFLGPYVFGTDGRGAQNLIVPAACSRDTGRCGSPSGCTS